MAPLLGHDPEQVPHWMHLSMVCPPGSARTLSSNSRLKFSAFGLATMDSFFQENLDGSGPSALNSTYPDDKVLGFCFSKGYANTKCVRYVEVIQTVSFEMQSN